MTDTLIRICQDKREAVARAKLARPLSEIDRAARAASPPRGFIKALETALARGQYGLIAEIKRASPSAGLIRPDFNPASLAQAYARGGAACLSVLTDEPYFQGSADDLIAARAAVSLPVLRKDFMLEPYQIVESRAIGADCVLLIMAALSDDQAAELEATALEYDMDVLVEVHDRNEVERALQLTAKLVGINNRNLKTLITDLATTEELSKMLPSDRIMVSESGLATASDLARMSRVGARCFLVGESLMRKQDVEAATRALLGLPL